MKHDYSTTDGRIWLKDCYYTVEKDQAKEMKNQGLCYIQEVWQEGAITYKQYK